MATGAPKVLLSDIVSHSNKVPSSDTRPTSDRADLSNVVDASLQSIPVIDKEGLDALLSVCKTHGFIMQDSSDPMQNSNGRPTSTSEETVSMLDKAVSMLDKAVSVLDKAGSVLEKTVMVWDKAVILWDKAFILLRKLRRGTSRVIPHADHHMV